MSSTSKKYFCEHCDAYVSKTLYLSTRRPIMIKNQKFGDHQGLLPSGKDIRVFVLAGDSSELGSETEPQASSNVALCDTLMI